MSSVVTDRVVLVTGGTGSFGQAFVAEVLANHHPKRVIVFSDTESNQSRMKEFFPPDPKRLEYFLGNVRDYDRLRWAFSAHVDIVVHAAAMKEVPTCEYDWPEACATNIDGSRNVALAAIECGVPKALLVSTDKACLAVTSYGKTKAVAEEWFVRSNVRACATGGTRLSAVRYGNVVASRGSVVPLFLRARARGEALRVTDPRMTRFWWSLEAAVQFVLMALDRMQGGDIFVPKLAMAPVLAVAKAIAPDAPVEYVGIRGKEKLHEMLISADEARHGYELDNCYVILPSNPTWPIRVPDGAKPLPDGFVYQSDGEAAAVEWRPES